MTFGEMFLDQKTWSRFGGETTKILHSFPVFDGKFMSG
jgi:hypothetical protein